MDFRLVAANDPGKFIVIARKNPVDQFIDLGLRLTGLRHRSHERLPLVLERFRARLVQGQNRGEIDSFDDLGHQIRSLTGNNRSPEFLFDLIRRIEQRCDTRAVQHLTAGKIEKKKARSPLQEFLEVRQELETSLFTEILADRDFQNPVFFSETQDLLSHRLPLLSCHGIIFAGRIAMEDLELLRSADPQIRAKAIKNLVQANPDEVLIHLRSMMLDPAPHIRILALQNAVLMPLAMVKPLLLDFISIENDPDLLRRASLAFRINPDIEVPPRLWQILETSSPEKAVFLKLLLQDAVAVIRTSDLLGTRFGDYRQRLQTWIDRRTAHRVVETLINRIQDEDDASATGTRTREEILLSARSILSRPLVREALEGALSWPLTTKVRESVVAFLGKIDPAPAPSSIVPTALPDLPHTDEPQAPEPASPRPETAIPLSCEEQVDQLNVWPQERLQEAIPVLERLTSPDTEPELLAAAFRLASRLGWSGGIEAAVRGLSSPCQNLQVAAIDHVSRVAPDRVRPMLGQLLRRGSLRIRQTAMKAMRRHDPQSALDSLLALLGSESLEQQTAGMSCLVQFDFDLVSPALAAFLEATPPDSLFKRGLCLFRANPSPEHQYLLYKLERSLTGERSRLVKETREASERLLLKLGRIDPGERQRLVAANARRYQLDQQKRKTPPKTASVQSSTVAPTGNPLFNGLSEWSKRLRDWWG